MLEMFLIRQTSIWPNFILIVLRIQQTKQKYNFHYAVMSMMMSQILKFVDFTKTQKSKYLENKTIFFLQIKNSLITYQGLLYGKKTFAVELTFKTKVGEWKICLEIVLKTKISTTKITSKCFKKCFFNFFQFPVFTETLSMNFNSSATHIAEKTKYRFEYFWSVVKKALQN